MRVLRGVDSYNNGKKMPGRALFDSQHKRNERYRPLVACI